MPRELKVDRTIHEVLRRYGAKVPGEVGLHVPIQLQAIVDDLAHLTPPLNVPVASVGHGFQGAVVGQRGVPIEWFIQSAGGAWIRWCSCRAGDALILITAAMVTDVAPVAMVPNFNTQNMGGAGALQSVAIHGLSTIAAVGAEPPA